MEKIGVSVILGGLVVLLVHLYNLLILKPKLLRGKLQRQGIRGPSPSFLFGNIPQINRSRLQVHSTPTTAAEDSLAAISHDWPSTIFPYLAQWTNEFGTTTFPHFFLIIFKWKISCVLIFILSIPKSNFFFSLFLLGII